MASEDDPWIIPTPDTEMSDMQFVGEIFRAKNWKMLSDGLQTDVTAPAYC